ncbi:MAG: hypothetical protein U5R30_01055 [Deltaproteobacteria bacterium]|nr:hypothetical protein [Deltaproteobacteria bacterium]
MADGKLMGWVYKLAQKTNSPLTVFFGTWPMFARNGARAGNQQDGGRPESLLTYQKKDLPTEITRMNFASTTAPSPEGGFFRELLWSQTGTQPIEGNGESLADPLTAKATIW